MKNPMDRQLEKNLAQRAVAIGREGDVSAFDELLQMLHSSSANVRRLTASALGKLAWMGVDYVTASSTVVSATCNVGPALGNAGPTENYFGLPMVPQDIKRIILPGPLQNIKPGKNTFTIWPRKPK